MNYYIVQNVYTLPISSYEYEYFLVQASSKKEAIDKVYILYGDEIHKKYFIACPLEEFFNENEVDDVAVIH